MKGINKSAKIWWIQLYKDKIKIDSPQSLRSRKESAPERSTYYSIGWLMLTLSHYRVVFVGIDKWSDWWLLHSCDVSFFPLAPVDPLYSTFNILVVLRNQLFYMYDCILFLLEILSALWFWCVVFWSQFLFFAIHLGFLYLLTFPSIFM